MSSDKRTVPGTQTIGFLRPTRTSGLETLAKTYEGQQETFPHAVLAFNPDLTAEEIAAKEQELIEDQKEVRFQVKPFKVTLLGKKIEYSLSKMLLFYQRPSHVKLSNLQIQVVCYVGVSTDANEFVVRIDDKRSTPPREVRVVITTTNKAERIPFDLDFSVPRKDFKKIFLVVERAKLDMDKEVAWGQMQCSAVLSFLKHPKLSAITPVKSTTLLPVGALDDQIYDPSRQDKRLSQAGLDALKILKPSIRNETFTDRGAVMRKSLTGTLRYTQGVPAYAPHEEETDSIVDVSDDPIKLQEELKKQRANLSRWDYLQTVEEENEANFPSTSDEKIFLGDDIGSVFSGRSSGIIINQGSATKDSVNPRDVLMRDSSPHIIEQSSENQDVDVESIRSKHSHLSDSNPFKEAVIQQEIHSLRKGKGKAKAVNFSYLPTIID